MCQFGEMAVVKTAVKLKSKLDDRGVACIYLGRSPDHGDDVHQFLHLKRNQLINSRDVVWLNKVHGDWKGLRKPSDEQVVIIQEDELIERPMPAEEAPAEEPEPPVQQEPALQHCSSGTTRPSHPSWFRLLQFWF